MNFNAIEILKDTKPKIKNESVIKPTYEDNLKITDNYKTCKEEAVEEMNINDRSCVENLNRCSEPMQSRILLSEKLKEDYSEKRQIKYNEEKNFETHPDHLMHVKEEEEEEAIYSGTEEGEMTSGDDSTSRQTCALDKNNGYTDEEMPINLKVPSVNADLPPSLPMVDSGSLFSLLKNLTEGNEFLKKIWNGHVANNYCLDRDVSGGSPSLPVRSSPSPPLSPSAEERTPSQSSISDDELLSLSVQDLNRRLRMLPTQLANYFKQRRRTLKNRTYAANCRMRRTSHRHEMEKTIKELEDTMKRQQTEIRYMKTIVALLKARNTELQSENDALKGRKSNGKCCSEENNVAMSKIERSGSEALLELMNSSLREFIPRSVEGASVPLDTND